MNSARNKIALIILAVALVGAFVGYKIIYKPHQTIEEQAIDFDGKAEDFKTEVTAEPEKWQNKIVMLQGSVSAVDASGSMLNETIFCQFSEPEKLLPFQVGDQIQIKGRFIGYDDLLEEIKLDNCIRIK